MSGMIILRNGDALEKLREFVNLDETELLENALAEYPDISIGGTGVTKQNIIDLLEMIDTRTVPVSPDLKLSGITYYPDYPQLYISFKNGSGEIYGFNFLLKYKNVEEVLQKEMGKKPTSIYQKENDRLKVYNTTGENDSDTNHIVFLMDIDGYFVRAGYRNNEKDVSKMKPDELFKDFSLTYLKDIPWAD